MKRVLAGVAAFFVFCLLDACPEAYSQNACSGGGKQSVGRRWDAVLGRSWEMVRDCSHPDWPGRVGAISTVLRVAPNKDVSEVVVSPTPILMHAGDNVTLLQQSDMVRILISGVVERSARMGERVTVRVTRAGDGGGLTVERIAGIVRGSTEVEMER